ncbi:prolyl oligopeptidase family serine peptidase [Sphingomonas sp. CL5.1]|uniref:S9 family peptidase n=1 Tax=Sphingomonas sp. CL5.1 TaxID=2653203 RepID=UPI00158223F0|nr:S9 family peptidase [Sphingomonas sp. CL5.1]QKS00906.1 prolyl oligopeptidase family serine peptidase [Sphingomonas sp. CL5.1]
MRAWPLAIALACSAANFAVPAVAETVAAPQALTLERVFASPDLSGPQPQALRLSPDGSLLTLVRNRADERTRYDLWAIDTRTGAERMLVDSRQVGSGAALSEAEKMQRERDRSKTGKTGVLDYDWSPDSRSLLVPVDGELFLADLAGGTRRIEGTKGVLNPAISPRGGFLSFVRDQNLWVQPLAGGAARALTSGGGGTVHFGEAEFVAQEEMDRRTGYWWSPDDRLLAVERFDEAPVKVFTRAAIGASGTNIYQQRYPAAGTPNALVELWVMRADGSGQVKVDLGADPDFYLARVNWLPDGSALLVQRESRDQRALDMLRIDPATGNATVMFTEKAGEKSWINLSDAYRVMPDGSLLWRSERDGFAHLYRWKAGKWTQLTKGDWVVSALVGVDDASGRIFFTGNRDGVLEQHLYALEPDGHRITRLTEAGWWNGASADARGSRFIITRSNSDQPPQTYLADANGKRLSWINQNAVAGDHPYAPYLAAQRPTGFGTLKAADGTTLYWKMIAPPLEPGKKYPVFFQHYGGPGSQTVTRAWNPPLMQYLARQGWIVFQLDNRGSPNRGKKFEDAIWHAMGTVEVEDQLAGARYLKSLPFVDGDRIATYGWSYGGYMSLKMLEKNPGVYAAAVAGAPVTDWSLYDTHYTERYMGDPAKDAAGYAASSALPDATGIRDPLLIMHGMADDNVFLDNTTAFAARLQAADMKFEMMLYPGKTHGAVREIHPWTTMLDFLDRTVKNKPAR